MAPRRTSTKGFKRTDSLLSAKIRQASETRGFAQSRLLTQWAEIVGQDVAAISRPVEVSYGRGGMGATLTLLTTGANAPMLEMQKEQLRAKVNAIYGFNAIARVRVTQTAASSDVCSSDLLLRRNPRPIPNRRTTPSCNSVLPKPSALSRTRPCAMHLHVWARTY